MATCSECTYLKINGECNNGKFWCEKDLEWHYANEAECYRFCKAYSRSDSVARSYYEKSERAQSSGGCYLTTITCEILGLPDNNMYLQTLRDFRKETLQKEEKYKELLVEYDIVGPIIANKLKQEKESVIIANNLLRMGIAKTVYHILNEEKIEAIKAYTDMTKLLIQAYDINIKPNQEQINNADITKSGHGVYVKTKK